MIIHSKTETCMTQNHFVSVYQKISSYRGDFHLLQILEGIRDGQWKEQVARLRRELKEGNDTEAEKLKKQLPAFTLSATYRGRRIVSEITAYSGYIMLDIDKLTPSEAIRLRSLAATLPHTVFAFVSPSECGLKIGVQPPDGLPLTLRNHRDNFQASVVFYEEHLGVRIDPSGKDAGRLCFVSFDPDIYIRREELPCRRETQPEAVPPAGNAAQQPSRAFNRRQINCKLSAAHRDADKVAVYEPGNRNNFVYLFSHYCRRRDLSQENVKDYCRLNFADLDEDEMTKTVDSAYGAPPEEQTEKTKNGEKTPSLRAIANYLQQQYILRYNVITHRIEIRLKKSRKAFVPVDERMLHTLWCEMTHTGLRCRFTTFRILLYSHFVKDYNPFEDYFRKLPPWDGVTDHIGQMAARVTTTRPELWDECFRRWIVAMVACALVPEVINHTVLVLTGPQGVGKTSWCMNLIPPELRNHVHSGPADPRSKDIRLALTECILINLDELGALGERDLNQLKEMITTSIIRERRYYGRDTDTYVRRCSFTASANTTQVLSDLTGARRFLCFETLSIDYRSPVDYDALYAQVLAVYQSGYKYWFDGCELDTLHSNNESFRIQSPEEELFLTYFRLPEAGESATLLLSSAQILQLLTQKAPVFITRQAVNNLTVILKKHGFEQIRHHKRRVFRVVKIDEEEVERRKKEDEPGNGDEGQGADDQSYIPFD